MENKPPLDSNQHFLSPWINAPQIAVLAVFVIRALGKGAGQHISAAA